MSVRQSELVIQTYILVSKLKRWFRQHKSNFDTVCFVGFCLLKFVLFIKPSTTSRNIALV